MKLKLNRQPRLPVLSAERFGAKKDDVNYEEALQDLSLIFLGNGDDIGKHHLQGSNVFGKRESSFLHQQTFGNFQLFKLFQLPVMSQRLAKWNIP